MNYGACAEVANGFCRPSEEQFRNFESYLRSVEKQYVSHGVVRVVPPASWRARSSGYDFIENGKLDFPIKTAIEQNPVGAMGIYRQYHGKDNERTA